MATQNEFEGDGPSTSKRSKLENVGTNKEINKGVDERIFTYVSDLVPFGYAKFGILQLGPYCNATESCSFTEANCHAKTVMNENELALILEFNQLFSKGVQLLSDLNGKTRDLEEHELAAIKILDDFFKEKDQHEQSLNKILRRHQCDGERKVNSETDITIALAEHLLGKLSPGKSYTIDSRVKKKGKCKCGFSHCNSNPVFGSTGIGHEEVWHGFIDIVFSSHAGVPETAASFVDDEEGSETLTCSFDEKEDGTEGDSPGERTIAEVKLSLSGSESQAIAQTIVFSFIQKKRHPNFSNFLIPNIFISSHDFRIIMYDAMNDILICSVPLPIFQPYPSSSLQIQSIIILWMVLHYRMFCVGIDTKSIGEMKKIQSNFKDHAKDKLDLYLNASKFGVQGFPLVPRVILPSHELLGLGTHLIPQK